MLLSRSYSTGNRAQPLSFHILLKSCVCKLFRFTYFPKTVHLCQNNGFQFLQNHILMDAVSATPLESHTSKIRGWGGCPSDFQLQTDHPTRMLVPSERTKTRDRSSNLQQ